MVMSWARAIMSISKKVWTFPVRLYYYILLFPKINRKPNNSKTEGRKGHTGPLGQPRGEELPCRFLSRPMTGTTSRGRAALKVPFSSWRLPTICDMIIVLSRRVVSKHQVVKLILFWLTKNYLGPWRTFALVKNIHKMLIYPWMSLIFVGPFGSVQNIYRIFGLCQKVLDIWFCPKLFVMDQLYSWMFCIEPSLCVDHNKLWKVLKEMGIPDHLTSLLGNLYAG